jgi:hypothetical protein
VECELSLQERHGDLLEQVLVGVAAELAHNARVDSLTLPARGGVGGASQALMGSTKGGDELRQRALSPSSCYPPSRRPQQTSLHTFSAASLAAIWKLERSCLAMRLCLASGEGE